MKKDFVIIYSEMGTGLKLLTGLYTFVGYITLKKVLKDWVYGLML
jgi:hypothetical protein